MVIYIWLWLITHHSGRGIQKREPEKWQHRRTQLDVTGFKDRTGSQTKECRQPPET